MKNKHIIIGVSIFAVFLLSCEKKNPELIESYFFESDSVEFAIEVSSIKKVILGENTITDYQLTLTNIGTTIIPWKIDVEYNNDWLNLSDSSGILEVEESVDILISNQTDSLFKYSIIEISTNNKSYKIPFFTIPIFFSDIKLKTFSEVELTGSVIADSLILEYGHCWSKNNLPTPNDNKTTFTDANSINFISSIQNLELDEVYYSRVYAITKFNDTLFSDTHEFFTKMTPESYHGIPENLKEDILIEDYNNNENGIRHIVKESSEFYPIQFDITQYENFEIECLIKTPQSNESYAGGFFWEGTNLAYNFIFGNDISYSIGVNNNSIIGWDSGAITANYNIFTIRKYNGIYYVFINKDFRLARQFNSFGHSLGFIVFSDIFVDYLHIRKLN